MSPQSNALTLAQRAVAYLYKSDPEFVVGFCSNISEAISAWLRGKGHASEPVYGGATVENCRHMHAWMIVDGERFDPVFWVQDIMVSEYNEDPVVARSLRRSDVRLKQIVQDTIEKLDKAIA